VGRLKSQLRGSDIANSFEEEAQLFTRESNPIMLSYLLDVAVNVEQGRLLDELTTMDP